MLFIIEGNTFSNNAMALDNMDFLHLGRLVALTILQCGPGLPVFDSPVAEYILSGRIENLDHTDFPTKYQSLVEQVTFI